MREEATCFNISAFGTQHFVIKCKLILILKKYQERHLKSKKLLHFQQSNREESPPDRPQGQLLGPLHTSNSPALAGKIYPAPWCRSPVRWAGSPSFEPWLQPSLPVPSQPATCPPSTELAGQQQVSLTLIGEPS